MEQLRQTMVNKTEEKRTRTLGVWALISTLVTVLILHTAAAPFFQPGKIPPD